jgi:hypothetical protein
MLTRYRVKACHPPVPTHRKRTRAASRLSTPHTFSSGLFSLDIGLQIVYIYTHKKWPPGPRCRSAKYAEAVATNGCDRRRPHGKAEDRMVGRKTDGRDRLASAS